MRLKRQVRKGFACFTASELGDARLDCAFLGDLPVIQTLVKVCVKLTCLSPAVPGPADWTSGG